MPYKPRRLKHFKPILMPGCNLEYARGIYQGEGTFARVTPPKAKRTRL